MSFPLSFTFLLSVTSIDETLDVGSSSFTIIPSYSISLRFSHAGSSIATGIFLGGWTTVFTEESTYRCTLFGSVTGLSLKQSGYNLKIGSFWKMVWHPHALGVSDMTGWGTGVCCSWRLINWMTSKSKQASHHNKGVKFPSTTRYKRYIWRFSYWFWRRTQPTQPAHWRVAESFGEVLEIFLYRWKGMTVASAPLHLCLLLLQHSALQS